MARKNVDGVQLTGSLVTLYTVTAGFQLTYIEITMHNTDTSARQVECQFIPSGQSANDKYKVVDLLAGSKNDLKAGETRVYRGTPMLDPGDFIQMLADTTLKVNVRMGILEEAV